MAHRTFRQSAASFPWRRTVLAGASALLLSACAASGETGDGSPDSGGGETPECPRGQIWNGEACVLRGEPDVDLPDGADVDAGIDDATPEVGGACTPNTRFCQSIGVAAICDANGVVASTTECQVGEACVEGTCALSNNTGCTPGEVVRCGGPNSILLCAPNGVDTVEDPCPADAPNCLGGACTSQICTPSRRFCDGNAIVVCAEDGASTTVSEICETGCSGGECVDPCAGDGKSYVGCNFVALDLDNFSSCSTNADCDGGSCVDFECTDGGANAQQFAITVSNTASRAVDIVVRDGDGNEVATRTIASRALEAIALPRRDVSNSSLNNNTYAVEATGPITVHQFNPQNNSGAFSNDASLLLPSPSLGTEYIVMGWPTVATAGGPALKSFVAIASTSADPTTVLVTSPIATLPGPGGVPAALVPNVAAEFTLTRGQVLSFATTATQGADFTGMTISASERVAVFSGSECANVPLDNQFCDHIEQQLYPLDTWGREFIAAKFQKRGREPDVWRVLASQNGTTVRIIPNIDNLDGRVLNRGEVLEFRTDRDFIIGGSAPISVAQFMVGSSYPGRANGCDRGNPFGGNNCSIPVASSCANGTAIGDPAFLMSVPTEQYRTDYIVLTPQDYRDNYLTIVAPQGTTIELDGTAITTAPSNIVAGWDIHRVPVAAGTHTVNAERPVGLFAYGYDCDVSYAYPGGLNLESR